MHTSTSGCSRGRAPSFLKRRSSASDAHRYWVGLSPIVVKARRQAWISGSSLSVAPASRDLAMAVNLATLSSAAASPERPVANTTPATS